MRAIIVPVSTLKSETILDGLSLAFRYETHGFTRLSNIEQRRHARKRIVIVRPLVRASSQI